MANAEIRVKGTSLVGENVVMTGFSDAKGDYNFSMIPEGRYGITAYLSGTFDGHDNWIFPLHPTDGSAEQVDVKRSSGINRNFRWQLTGQVARPLKGYYGATITIGFKPSIPHDSYVEFRLTPASPLVDGTQGRPMVVGATMAKWLEGGESRIVDIPLGSYDVTSFVRLSNGVMYQFILSNESGNFYERRLTARVRFAPNESDPRFYLTNGIALEYLWVDGQ